jgi:hypothetical protein
MEDDMMDDKISSSPSIDEGVYKCFMADVWLRRYAESEQCAQLSNDTPLSFHTLIRQLRVFTGLGTNTCLADDINFDFVYALHTFIATVEGQANASKGDTMVLLDDSNSYWWLVRIIKDNSIGW